MSVRCECCVLSGRILCDALVTRQEESYRLGCVVVCDLYTSRMRRSWPALGRSGTEGGKGDHTYLTTVSEVEGIKSDGKIIRDLINSEGPVSRVKWYYRSFTN